MCIFGLCFVSLSQDKSRRYTPTEKTQTILKKRGKIFSESKDQRFSYEIVFPSNLKVTHIKSHQIDYQNEQAGH